MILEIADYMLTLFACSQLLLLALLARPAKVDVHTKILDKLNDINTVLKEINLSNKRILKQIAK